MRLSRYEQEVVINFNAEEPNATIYSSNPVWMRKLRRHVEENPQDYRVIEVGKVDGEEISITVECPKRFVKLALRDRKLNLTDEQRAEMAARLRKNTEVDDDVSQRT